MLNNLLKLESTVKLGFQTRKNTCAIFLDIANAYPSTWTSGLLYKLTRLRVKGFILKWINFLRNRSFLVNINGTYSRSQRLTNGVPQGSVMNPILFNIMTYDFPTNPLCDVSLFADDTTISTQAKTTEETINNIQPYIDQIEKWAKNWRFELSVRKSSVVNFSTKRNESPNPSLTMYGKVIPVKDEVKFLGITIDKKLNWKTQVDNQITQITRKTNIIKVLANHKPGMRIETLILLYKSLIRSKIDYGSFLLNTTRKNIKIEWKPPKTKS